MSGNQARETIDNTFWPMALLTAAVCQCRFVKMTCPKGSRFSNVQVRNRASGKDGHTTFGAVYATGNVVNNYRLYTQTFVDYVLAQGSISSSAAPTPVCAADAGVAPAPGAR